MTDFFIANDAVVLALNSIPMMVSRGSLWDGQVTQHHDLSLDNTYTQLFEGFLNDAVERLVVPAYTEDFEIWENLTLDAFVLHGSSPRLGVLQLPALTIAVTEWLNIIIYL